MFLRGKKGFSVIRSFSKLFGRRCCLTNELIRKRKTVERHQIESKNLGTSTMETFSVKCLTIYDCQRRFCLFLIQPNQ